MAQIPIYPPEDHNLQQVIAAENAKMAENDIGDKIQCPDATAAGQGCRERYVVWHSYANGVPISRTVVAIAFNGTRVTQNSAGIGTTWMMSADSGPACVTCSSKSLTRTSGLSSTAATRRRRI